MSKPFPLIPPEIRDLILETALHHSIRESLRELWRFLVLARETRQVLEITFYESIVVSKRVAEPFLRNLESKPQRSALVKALCLYREVPNTIACRIVAMCGNLRRLAHWGHEDDQVWSIFLAAATHPPLSLSISFFSQPPFHSLGSLRFLEVCDAYEVLSQWNWDGLAELTHLKCLRMDNFTQRNGLLRQITLEQETESAELLKSIMARMPARGSSCWLYPNSWEDSGLTLTPALAQVVKDDGRIVIMVSSDQDPLWADHLFDPEYA